MDTSVGLERPKFYQKQWLLAHLTIQSTFWPVLQAVQKLPYALQLVRSDLYRDKSKKSYVPLKNILWVLCQTLTKHNSEAWRVCLSLSSRSLVERIQKDE